MIQLAALLAKTVKHTNTWATGHGYTSSTMNVKKMA
jgi:hypothetical protein